MRSSENLFSTILTWKPKKKSRPTLQEIIKSKQIFASPRPSIGNISAASLILHPCSTRTQDDDDAANSLMTFSFTLRFTRQPLCRNVLSRRRVVPSRRTMSKPVFWVVGRKKIQWGGKLDWLVLDGSRFFFPSWEMYILAAGQLRRSCVSGRRTTFEGIVGNIPQTWQMVFIAGWTTSFAYYEN